MVERDRFLTEAMGHVWHECQDNPGGFFCRQCAEGLHHTAGFSTWDGFGELWAWAKKQGWWFAFRIDSLDASLGMFPCEYVDPGRFADAVYRYLKATPCAP